MTGVLRIVLFVGIIFYLIFITSLVKKRSLDLRYSLLWYLTAVVLLVLDIFPQVVTWASHLLGIQTESNFIYLVIMFFMLLLLITVTSIVSKQKAEIRTLIQRLSILEKETKDKKS